ncbi:MAG: PRC-barrel domain-containing protein [Thermoleophilaceae bacterium]|nr:PRC-barrel domain-containing protein [Thermoleophilaceae bacterium]
MSRGFLLSDLLGRWVSDAAGRELGRLRDLAVSPGRGGEVVGVLVRRRGRPDLRLPSSAVESIGDGGIVVRETARAGQPGEWLLLGRDVLDAQVIDVSRRRLARVGDVLLTADPPPLRVDQVDVGLGAVARRLGLRRLSRRLPDDVVAWRDLHLASGVGHALQLATPDATVHHLGADELAEVVARLPRERGRALLARVGRDPAERVRSRLRRRPRRRRFRRALRRGGDAAP